MSGKFSPFVIKALVDTITGGAGNDNSPAIGIYRSGPKIEQFFLDCGLDMRIGASSRVPATTDFLRQTANHYDGQGDVYITRIIEKVCDPREYLTEPDKAIAVREHLNKALGADELAVVIVGGKAVLTRRQSSGTIVEPFIQKVETLDFDTVQMEIARALPNLQDDPEDAVTAACSLIEAVCRSILIELGLPLPPRKDIDGLIRAVQEPLNLSPGRTDLPAEIEGDIRQILSGLTSVAKGIGALRTHGGDAHGREKGFRRIDPRIARLAINAASSLALFLIETWERQEKRALPQHAQDI
ncbi:abortive infection family protein [Sphingobium sp. H39-3-25]|uniref:abortive infection family protein n=1 Tax=Sphingobium arseniciresistens TaxID=3030834 RepID=UPI0023B9EA2B|nr:abortive infection family protein [Sphingobium arseniciresistens]